MHSHSRNLFWFLGHGNSKRLKKTSQKQNAASCEKDETVQPPREKEETVQSSDAKQESSAEQKRNAKQGKENSPEVLTMKRHTAWPFLVLIGLQMYLYFSQSELNRYVQQGFALGLFNFVIYCFHMSKILEHGREKSGGLLNALLMANICVIKIFFMLVFAARYIAILQKPSANMRQIDVR